MNELIGVFSLLVSLVAQVLCLIENAHIDRRRGVENSVALYFSKRLVDFSYRVGLRVRHKVL